MALTLGLLLTIGVAAGCSGVDDNDNDNQHNNNNAPVGRGTLTGQVSTVVTCDATDTESDCAGTVYLVLMAENPVVNPFQTPEAIEILPSADLGAGPVTYTINNVSAGTWYVSGFLDDDNNASGALSSPDVGDPVAYPAPQVTIVADDTTTQNVTLTTRMP
jgi:hypothetical protein